MLSLGQLVKPGQAVAWRGPMAGNALSQLLDADWSGCDVLIVDLPPGTGDIQLSMIQKHKPAGSVIVSTPQDLALIDATRAIDLFRQAGCADRRSGREYGGLSLPAIAAKSPIRSARAARRKAAAQLGLPFPGPHPAPYRHPHCIRRRRAARHRRRHDLPTALPPSPQQACTDWIEQPEGISHAADRRCRHQGACSNRTRTIALVGASPKPERDSNRVMGFLLAPKAIASSQSIRASPGQEHPWARPVCRVARRHRREPVDLVDIFRNSEAAGRDGGRSHRRGRQGRLDAAGRGQRSPPQRAPRRQAWQVVMDRCPKVEIPASGRCNTAVKPVEAQCPDRSLIRSSSRLLPRSGVVRRAR
jgi:predicted CoA-binding protein